ncbi:MAG: SDR family oxidoreductase [Saprospiraceae bacterium]
MTKKNILLTGGAGFIGSNLLQSLLKDPRVNLVRVLDNLSTGHRSNIDRFEGTTNYEFILGDIRDMQTCLDVCDGIDLICHQAALGSVPRSVENPILTNEVNITGTLNIFKAAVDKGIKRVVFAASSSTYGDSETLPKEEDVIGAPLSPYAVTKYVNELYAQVFNSTYKLDYIGLRYFNVFGPHQSPDGPYAAVIPLFIKAALENKSPNINGNGENSRDFTYIENAVHANLLALFTEKQEAINQIYNIAYGEQTNLNQLWKSIKELTHSTIEPCYGPPRKGDVKYSVADIHKAQQLLGYKPGHSVEDGLKETIAWFKTQ